MGMFFSLHEAREWEQAVMAMPEPSIWSHASFSPLTREQKVLLERPGRVEHGIPCGLQQGQDKFILSESAELSMLVCFDQKSGHFYAGLLLTAPESQPHVYKKSICGMVLKAPGHTDSVNLNESAMTSQMSEYISNNPGRSRIFDDSIDAEGGSYSPVRSSKDRLARLSASDSAPTSQATCTFHGKMGIVCGEDGIVQVVNSNTPADTQAIKAGDKIVNVGTNPFSLERLKSAETSGSDFNVTVVRAGLADLWQEGPMHETTWRYMLLYNVREGVLLYCSQDQESCKEAIREIGNHWNVKPPPMQGDTATRPQASRVGTGSVSVTEEVKCLDFKVGKSQGVCRILTEVIRGDLPRRFEINCDVEEQHECTNCVIFCLRAIVGLQLSVRGYDLKKFCEEHLELGHKAGDAVADAWEKMWTRSGGVKGFAEPVSTDGSRWHKWHGDQGFPLYK